MCEEFDALPSAIYAEQQRLPVGMLERVLEARYYALAKARSDAADTPEAKRRLPRTPLYDLVKVIEFELAKAARESAEAKAAVPRRRRQKRRR